MPIGTRYGFPNPYGGYSAGINQLGSNLGKMFEEQGKLNAKAKQYEAISHIAPQVAKQALDSGAMSQQQYLDFLAMKPEAQAQALGTLNMVMAHQQQRLAEQRAQVTQQRQQDTADRQQAAADRAEARDQAVQARVNQSLKEGPPTVWKDGVPWKIDPVTGQATQINYPSAPDQTVTVPGPGGQPVQLPVTSKLGQAELERQNPQLNLQSKYGLTPDQVLDPSQAKTGFVTNGSFIPSGQDQTGATHVKIGDVTMPVNDYAIAQQKLRNAGYFPPPSQDLPPADQQLQSVLQQHLQQAIQSGVIPSANVQQAMMAGTQGTPLPPQAPAGPAAPPPAQAQATPPPQLSPVDQQALQWAQSNADDPRSAAIFNKLGMTPPAPATQDDGTQ